MRRPNETKQDYALRRTWLLIKSNIPDKHMTALKEYVDGLSEKELDCYINLANNLYDRRTLGARSIKVTSNAVKLCVKLSKLGHNTFPYIEKLATRGWDTAGGTYSFSMPLLTNGVNSTEIFSYGPINKLVKDSAELDVGYSEATRALEVDYK